MTLPRPTEIPRRTFLTATAAALLVPYRSPAAQNCNVLPNGVQLCSADVTPQMARLTQQCPAWCWAASISMIFNFYGHQVPQQQIVQRVFGVPACAPSGNTANIGNALSTNWVDTQGRQFSSNVIAAFDPANNISNLDNAVIVNEIANNQPMLYCNTHHAMVVCSVQFIPTAMGPNVQQVVVADPWPYSPAYHPISPAEAVPATAGGQMTFLAAVRVN